MVCEPVAVYVDTVQVATPKPLTPVPEVPPHAATAIPLSMNSTLPEFGVPEPGGVAVTVAVYTTGWPTTEGEPVVDTTTVEVGAVFTTWVIEDDTADAT